MKKIKATILSVLACTALGIAGAAFFHAQPLTQAKAENTSIKTTLLSPVAYEEYLNLIAPADVAVCEKYTAIADGNVIYIYDRETQTYRKYSHEVNAQDPLKNNVTKLQFDSNGKRLYFLDATYLYILDMKSLYEDTLTVAETKFNCSNFYLHENVLYYTDVKTKAQLSKIDISNLDFSNPIIDGNQAVTLASDLSGNPTITLHENELYYTNNYIVLRKINLIDGTNDYVATFPHLSGISSITIEQGILVCTDNPPTDNAEISAEHATFYAYRLSELNENKNAEAVAPIASDTGTYAAVTAYNGNVYAVKENSVRHFSLAEEKFTSYEICSESDSLHRLNHGTEMIVAEGKLFIADDGNDRISVYDTQTSSFLSPISSTLTAEYLSADSKTVLAATETEAILYSISESNYGTPIAVFDDFNGDLIGVTNVYGKYYFATEHHCHYVAQENADGWVVTKTERQQKWTPTLLTSDVYGNLYLTYEASVYKLTEEEFISPSHETTQPVCTNDILLDSDKLLVDYAGSMYALTNGALQKLGEETPYELNTPLVYTDSAKLRSFAFSIEENITYLLYEENVLAQTNALDLPTVRNIAVNGADKTVFAEESAEFTVVETQAGALVVEFDIETLKGAEYFPYISYERKDSFTALRIGEAAPYSVLAVYNEETNAYTTCLVLTGACKEVDFRTDYETAKIGYLTSSVNLYKFPYLTELLTVAELERGHKLTILGEIQNLDYPYYHVEYTDGEKTMRGYVPQSFVSSFEGTIPESETVIHGGLEENNDGVWRLAYLVLGSAAICILIDILILKKKKED